MEYLWIAVALIAGAAGGYYARRVVLRGKQKSFEEKIEKDFADAKLKEQELIVQAKEKALEIIEEAKAEEQERRKELSETQKRLNEREERYLEKERHLDKTEDELAQQRKDLEYKEVEAHKLVEVASKAIEEAAGLSREEAREELFSTIEADEKEAVFQRIKKLQEQGEEEIEIKAQKLLSLAIEKFASSQVVDAATTYVDLPQEDMKGRIIGKEGRNIKALERLTGCEFIVDETPGKVMISGFSPVRRQVAKRALESLMKDGRIQPARIEESIEEAKKNLAKEMRKAGEDALIELGIPVSSIDPKLVSILGRLKFRTSYGQNVLQHSIEVARISGMLAEELGADVFNCKKGGLFHDIGKAVDHDMQGAHPEIGYQIMKKFGWPENLCYQSIAHHEDKPRTIEGVIVKAADAISGARPGARRNSVEDYLQRLQAIEETANGFEGVDQAYAIQAGREVRVFVNPEAMDDIAAYHLAVDIAKKIETTLTYPGEIKVTVIRETRVTEHAR
jgi:ribonuclease Y